MKVKFWFQLSTESPASPRFNFLYSYELHSNLHKHPPTKKPGCSAQSGSVKALSELA